MLQFYLIPIIRFVLDDGDILRGPKYIFFDEDNQTSPPALDIGPWGLMDYGFVDSALVVAKNISIANHTSLIGNADVFVFPDNLDVPVTDPNVDTFFEAIHIPTNWLTPSTDYRELLRQTAGMFLFNQRYLGISGGGSIFDNGRTLEDRMRDMSIQEEQWMRDTANSFVAGVGDVMNRNQRLRSLVKSAGDFWIGQPFFVAGVEF